MPGGELSPGYKKGKVMEDDLKCTCNDEFATTFCPVHPPDEVKDNVEYGKKEALIITDVDMVGYGQWEGYIFKCPNCGVEAIMVNPSMGKSCTNCKRDIEIRSKTITAKIRSLSGKPGV